MDIREAGPPEATGARLPDSSSIAVRVPWLMITRAVAVAVALPAVGLFIVSLPFRYQQLRNLDFFIPRSHADILRAVEPAGVRAALAQLGLSANLFAWYSLALEVAYAVVFCVVAGLIVRHRATSWWALYVSLVFTLFGTGSLPTMAALAGVYPALARPIDLVNILGWTLFGIFYYLSPRDGSCRPGRDRWRLSGPPGRSRGGSSPACRTTR